MHEHAVQRLPGAQPVSAAISRGEQDARACLGAHPALAFLAKLPAEVDLVVEHVRWAGRVPKLAGILLHQHQRPGQHLDALSGRHRAAGAGSCRLRTAGACRRHQRDARPAAASTSRLPQLVIVERTSRFATAAASAASSPRGGHPEAEISDATASPKNSLSSANEHGAPR